MRPQKHAQGKFCPQHLHVATCSVGCGAVHYSSDTWLESTGVCDVEQTKLMGVLLPQYI